MMRKKIILASLIVLSAALAYSYFSREKREINVLVFSKTESFRHESISEGIKTIVDLGKAHNYLVDTTEDASVFNEIHLKNYNVIVFLNTTGDVLNDAQQLEMNRWVQAGGGFVGIHSAADTEYEWPWYGELVGAYFDSHPNDPNVRTASIDRLDKDHISTVHLLDRWEKADEWYNYKDIQSSINILLNLDETSYEGGTNGENHPIAWYREFDGGRSWYTGLGHTSEIYQDPNFVKHLLGGIEYAAGPGRPVNYNNSSVAPEENRFQKVVLDYNLNEPMELEMLPNGDILFVERHGDIKLFEKDSKKAETVGTLSVFDDLEDGLLGLAIDPDYKSNSWIYLFYSPAGSETVQRVSRFVFKDKNLQIESERVLLSIPTQRKECCHAAGSLEFGADGQLYISVGDNTSPRATGYAPIDERDGRSEWDAQKSSANTQDLRGKILRIVPTDEGSYAIPDGNLFKNPEEGRPEIYVMGVRNPFRIAVDQKTGYLYWGDVGPDAGKDSSSVGSRGYDELNQARSAGNYGWPYLIGNNFAYSDYDFDKGVAGTAFDPKNLVNNSPNNTGAKQLPEARPAFIWYPYAPSEEFPLVGEGGRNAMAGPVFYSDDYPVSDSRYPSYYDGKLFTYDWMRGWIMAVTMDENGSFIRMERFLPSIEFNNPMDMIIGPAGDLYMLEYGTNWFSQNMDARLVHLSYSAGNRVPVAAIKPGQTIGKTPLTVRFSSEGTVDFDGDDLTYLWTFGKGSPSSEEENPEFTFIDPGEYTVTLTVTDPDGESAASSVTIIAGNDLPEVTWKLTGNSQFYWNNSIDYEVSVHDTEDGSLNKGIDPTAVAITSDYLARGYDMTEIAQGHQANIEASASLIGKKLMEQSDCKACHQVDSRSVGPTYKAIAAKYADNPTIVDKLAKKIIDGGSGVWGNLMMSPHPQLPVEEAKKMARYILSFSGKQVSGGLPPSGTVVFDRHQPGEMTGKYVLTASYTDRGANGIQPLTATKVIALAYPAIQAKDYTSATKAMTFNVKAEDVPLVEEDMTVVLPSHGAEITYEDIDLTGVGQLKFYIGVAPNYFSGGNMTVRIDGNQGNVIGRGAFEISLTSVGMKELVVDLEPVSGIHDLVFQFENKDPGKVFGGLGMIELVQAKPFN